MKNSKLEPVEGVSRKSFKVAGTPVMNNTIKSEGVSEVESLRRSNIILCSALRQAHALIENGMEIRAKTLIGHILDRKEVCK